MNLELMQYKDYLKLNNYSSVMYFYWIQRYFKEGYLFNQSDINMFILELQKKCAIGTVNTFIKASKIYIKFRELSIDLPRQGTPVEKLPEYINIEFFEKEMIPVVESEFTSTSIDRNKAILSLLFATGMRKSELLEVKRKDFNFSERTLIIHRSKSNDVKIVFYSEKISKLVQLYFSKKSETQNAFNIGKYSIDSVFRRIKPYLKGNRIYPHIMRSSFAVHMAERTEIGIVQQLLGHKSLSTTLRYTRRKVTDLKNIYDNNY